MPRSNGQKTKSSRTVGDFIVERLREWKVTRVFGFPGDGINGVLGAIRRSNGAIDFVQVANEELASMMACAHAKFTGEVGVCLSTGGPGAIHLLNGLYDAKLDHQPVVALVGQQSMAGLGGSVQQETNLFSILQDVASAYIETVGKPEQVRHVIDRAFRIAIGDRAVTALIIPHDVQQEDAVESPPREHAMQHSSPGAVHPRLLPREEELRRAADVLNAGSKVAILVGQGALHAGDEVAAVADALGAGVAKALLGKAALPDDLPFVTGSVGWLGTAASNWMMERCDTLVMVGSTMPYTEFLPKEGQARAVQIDIAPKSLGLRYPMEVMLAGDSAETLRALIPLLKRGADRSWRAEVERRTADWWATVDRQAHAPAPPLNPQLLLWELSRQLPDDAIITGDSGSAAVWLARFVRMRRGMKFSLSGGLATMGSAVPYALAAKIAFPERFVVAVAGDGAMQMSGLNALIDVAKYWRRWRDPRLAILVLNNRDLNYVTWEQRVMEGEPKFQASQDLPDIPYARYAELLGLTGARVDSPDGVADAWRAALAADRPFVIDAVVNADVPTLPPTVQPKLQEKLAAALEAGDPDADGVRQQLVEQGIEGA
ncbi:MAG TPA: thiamine pyrophosphate-requiring protein [Gemmatimonadaceae bacterium]